MEYIASLFANGVIMGLIYGLMALGLTLVFSILRIINFAHGEFYMLGGYFFYYLTVKFGLSPVPGLLIAVCGVFTLAMLYEMGFLRVLSSGRIERPDEYACLITFGLSFFLLNLALGAFGPFPHKPVPFAKGYTEFGFLTVSNSRLFAAGLALVFMAVLMVVIRKTWIGKALRAVSQNRDAAAVVGINSLRMNTIAFGIGSALAATAGALMAPIFSLSPDIGQLPGIRSFIIVILGGFGSIRGAILGGLIIGLVESVGSGLFPDPSRAVIYKPALGLLMFALVLLFRPQGLFGERA